MKNIPVMIALLLSFAALPAKYVSVKNEKQFHDEINSFDFALVALLPLSAQDKNDAGDCKKDMIVLKKMVKALAETEPFKKDLKQEVGFIVLDSAKDGIGPVLEKYSIKDNTTAHFVLFKDGKALPESLDSIKPSDDEQLTKADLLDGMNNYFGKEFDDILAKKSEEQAQEHQMQLARLQSYASARYPYGLYSPYNPWGSPAQYVYTGYAAFYPYGYSYNGYAYFIP